MLRYGRTSGLKLSSKLRNPKLAMMLAYNKQLFVFDAYTARDLALDLPHDGESNIVPHLKYTVVNLKLAHEPK